VRWAKAEMLTSNFSGFYVPNITKIGSFSPSYSRNHTVPFFETQCILKCYRIAAKCKFNLPKSQKLLWLPNPAYNTA